jgi:histidyl-tRNA synthetase
MARYSAPRGTQDLLPERIPLIDHVFWTCQEVIAGYGYLEIRPPLFEDTSLFHRSIGEVTDIVEKEMFTCQRADTSVTFRPEGTASVVRAYLESNQHKTRPFRKFWYIGPMFRFERPQRGRERQFYQVGIEAIGSHDPRLDAEVIHIGAQCYKALGLKGYRTCINTIGDHDDRERFREVVLKFVEPKLAEYCEDCRGRFGRNVFRVLDCKVRGCRELNRDAPVFLDHVSDTTRAHFDEVQQSLNALGCDFEVDKRIVRGFDYYTHTVFEYRLSSLGARDALGGGGRYNNLVEELDGPPTPAIGFSLGVTPMLLALEDAGLAAEHLGEPECPVFIVTIGDGVRLPALILAEELRCAGLRVDLDYEGKSPKAQMRSASKRLARAVVVLGEDERAQGIVQVKCLTTGKQEALPMDGDLPGEIQRILSTTPEAETTQP